MADKVMVTPINRRRSQRLFLQVPVVVQGHLSNKKPFSEEARTVVVNAHGALVEMGATLEQGQTVILRNSRTSEQIEATVKLVTPAEPTKFHVALEFNTPSPNFWHVSFPPDDWDIRNPIAIKKS